MGLRHLAFAGALLALTTGGRGIARESYASLDALPDFSGVWSPDWGMLFGAGGRVKPPPPPFTPAGQKLADAWAAGVAEGKNQQTEAANCIPSGMPQIMKMPYPLEFLYSPGRVTIAIETYSQVRRIYTDGRALPADPDLTFNGSSVGHWDGDTLVVDTIALSPLVTIMPGIHATPQTRIHEVMRLERPGRLMVETTLIDPTLFTAPVVSKLAYDRKDGWEMREYVCEENNRDKADAEGRASLDLGLDQADDPFGPPPPPGEKKR